MTSASLQSGLPLHTWSLVTAGRADLVLPPIAVPSHAYGSMALAGQPHMGMSHPDSSTAPWGAIGERQLGLWFVHINGVPGPV